MLYSIITASTNNVPRCIGFKCYSYIHDDVLVFHVGRWVLPLAPVPGALWYNPILPSFPINAVSYCHDRCSFVHTDRSIELKFHVCPWFLCSFLLHRRGVRGGHRRAALREEADRLAGAGVTHHLHPRFHDLPQRSHSWYCQFTANCKLTKTPSSAWAFFFTEQSCAISLMICRWGWHLEYSAQDAAASIYGVRKPLQGVGRSKCKQI